MANLDPNGVPILDLSDKSQQAVDKTRQAAAGGKPEYLIGEVAVLDNPGKPFNTLLQIGAETLDEALKSAVGFFDIHDSGPVGDPHRFDPPRWVASSHAALGKLLAEHYGCALKSLKEVS